jgi:hypothetical protein
MIMQPLATRIARQFDIVWNTIDETIALIPDGEWAAGKEGTSIPVVQLAHVAAAIALYLPPPGKHWPDWCESESGDFWWDAGPDPWPSKDEFGRYCTGVKAEVATWLASLDDAAMLEETLADDWRGNCLLDLAMYVLRHSQHHLGDLFAEMRRRGIDRPKWR